MAIVLFSLHWKDQCTCAFLCHDIPYSLNVLRSKLGIYLWQDRWSPKLSYCDYWGHLCFEWEVATIIGSARICHRGSSFWPSQTGFTWHTTCWSRTRRNNPTNIGNGLFILILSIFLRQYEFGILFSKCSALFFCTGISHVQGLHWTGPTNSSYKNYKQFQSIYWISESNLYFKGCSSFITVQLVFFYWNWLLYYQNHF